MTTVPTALDYPLLEYGVAGVVFAAQQQLVSHRGEANDGDEEPAV